MSVLKRAMSEYVNEVVLGRAPRTEALRSQLRAIQRRNLRYFTLVVIMLLMTFLVGMGIVVSGVLRHAAIPVASFLGTSVSGMIWIMLGLWREKVATELLIELSEFDDEILKQIVAKLIKRIR